MAIDVQNVLATFESGLKITAGAAQMLEELGVPVPGGPITPLALNLVAAQLDHFKINSPATEAQLRIATQQILAQCHEDLNNGDGKGTM